MTNSAHQARLAHAEAAALDDWLRRRHTCETASHPAATFNPWLNRTWCVCGWLTFVGDATSWVEHVCGHPCHPRSYVEVVDRVWAEEAL